MKGGKWIAFLTRKKKKDAKSAIKKHKIVVGEICSEE